MKHKIITLFFAMTASVLTLFAANGTCGDNLTWDLTNGVLTISGTGDMTDYSNMSSNITPWYSSRTSITSVVIGNGVTHIGNYAFYNCTKLTSANIPNSVTSIGDDAFYKCSSLTSITIPNSVTSIGSSAFYSTGLIEPVYNSHVFAYMPQSYAGAYIIPSGIESIAGAAFSGCKTLTSVTIPNSVISIGGSAFYRCSGLTTLTIPSNVTTIEYGAFADCSSLTSIIWNAKNCANVSSYKDAPFYNVRTQITSFTMGNEVENIPSCLCYEMSNLTSITIPNSVTSIGSSAFYGCTGLTSITIPNSVTSIGTYAFNGCTGLTSITIPNSTVSVGNNAFSGCTGLISVKIGSNVASLGSNAFSSCNNITSVVLNSNALVRKNYSTSSTIGSIFGSQVTEYRIGNSVTGIGNYAFYNCKNISSITIGDNVTSIGSYAFNGCTGLTSITIPNSVTSIGTYAFNGCTGLTSITIPENVTNIGVSAFSGCSSLTSVIWNAKNCSDFSSSNYNPFYNVRSQITSFTMGNEVENIPSCLCYEMSNLTSITIPNSVTSIGSSAFYGCTGLTSITIPNNVTSIGTYAFNGCIGLTSITIPNSVTSIGTYAFNGCNNLTSATLNSNTIVSKNYTTSSTISSIFGSQVTEYRIGNSVTGIGNYAFYNCKNISSITIGDNVTSIGSYAFNGCTGLTSITIPNGVTSIGSYAFNKCSNLSSITIPHSVASLSNNALSNCAITKINYIGTLEDWCNKNWYSTQISSNYQLVINGVLQEHVIVPNNITTIGSYVFRGCNSLQSIEIPNSITAIEASAFKGCSGLTSVIWNIINHDDFTSQLTPFYRAEDNNCTGCEFDIRPQITSIAFGDDVEYIPAYLCYGMSNISSVAVPNSVTSIGNYAFNGCSGMNSVTIGNSVTSIGNYAFNGCSGMNSVTIGNSVTSIGNYAFNGCSGLTSVDLPNSVTSIGTSAFKGCSGLTSLDIPGSVTTIANNAFYGCSGMNSVTIGNNVSSIGQNAFYSCSGLNSVMIPNSVTSIGSDAFKNCTNLTSVEWDANQYELTGQIFPNTLKTLVVGSHCDTINLNYIPAKEVILRNPMTVLTNIPRATTGSNLYDTKGAGYMYVVNTQLKYNTANVLIDNLYGITIDTLVSNVANKSWNACNVNNDSLVDLHCDGVIYESDRNGGYKQHDFSFLAPGKYAGAPRKYNHIFQLDANLDGLQDFYVYEDNKHYFQIRQWDGSYLKSELNILTDTSAIDSTIYQKWEQESDELFFITSTWDEISLKNTMYIAPGDPDDYYSTGFDFIDMAIDLDRNGLVDILSSTTGAVLYNLGGNTYVKGSFPGSVTPKDLNGDGVLDYVIYNKSTKTISLQIYEKDGTSTTKTLMQNMNISNVWCYDFDNDGDVDILLPFDWTSTSGYAFLVFWRNDGNNTFKKIENAFDDPIKHFQFLDCRDVDNDGKYEIIARDSLDSYTTYNTIHNGNYYLIRYNNRFKVSLDEPFVANSLSKKMNDPLFVCGDFNNDGVNDYYYTGGEKGPYTLAHFPYAAINTPPAKMSKPRIKVNAEKAMLSIDWDRGSDAQTSSLDLEYSIRIGSKPGACDIWFAAANADGKQRSLWGANVGAYLNQKVNVSTWKEGDYYIAVQAIDPNGLGGEWSDEVVYHHTLLSFGFNISNHNIKTTDTITVQFAGAVDESNTYNWDFGEGAVVISQYGQTYTIIYTTQGNKHISLQMTSADGRKSPLVTQEVNVLPLRIEKNPNYPNNGSDPYFTLSYFDMDMDGVMDGIGYQSNWSGYAKLQQGFFKGRGDGSFIKLAKTYNADLQVTGSVGDCVFADVNMDGLPDVVTQTSKGSIMYNMEDFDVEFSNDTYTLPSTPAPQYDFNNDGKPDTYAIKNKHTILLYLTTDQGYETVEVYLPGEFQLNELGTKYLKVGPDFDNNGHPDFISTVAPGVYAAHNDAFIIYLHDDFTATCQYIDGNIYTEIYDIETYPFADLNGDTVPDLTEYILKSNIKNEAPAVPTNLRAVQENDGVYLYWDAAKDKETPAAQMRYNISVKKKGVAVGTDNAFIVSPMNGLYDEAAIIPGYYYPHGTSYFIPIDKLTGGQTYEFQIQSIDLWNALSPMSAAYTFTVQPQVLISMPAQTCVNEPVTVAFTGTNNSGISWNFDGGVASQNTDGSYSVYWATEGVKTVKATLSGNTSSRVIYVQNAQKDLFFALPERVLSNSWTEVTLPAVYENLEHLAIRTSANCTGYVLPKKDSRIFQVCFKSTSTDDSEIGWVEFYQNDAFCGEMNTFRASTRIIGNGTAPVISLVMVDATTGKNMITWDTPANLPSYIDSMIIYKEEGKANNWVKQAKVPISAGQWIDQASDPSVKSNSYCIAYTSIYGGESLKSAAHKTPHLQTNYGLNGAINLYWTFYQGDVVDSYQILRGTSSSNMQVLATVAGDECTYTDNSPVENAYYAIAYSNAAFVNEWSYSAAANAPAYKALNAYGGTIRTGRSNIMEASASIQSMLATQLTILSMEKIYTLTPSRTTLHLYVEITPSNATFKQARWSIVSGHELATIYSNGLFVANTEGKNGTVRVRATAIDGSGVYAERDITVSGFKKTLSLSVNDPEMGKVNGAGQYSEGQIVTISATANEGYHFVQWNDGNTNNPRSIVFMHDTTFTAEFARNTYTIVATTPTEAYGSVTGGASALYKEQLTLVATPAECYHFVQWNDGNTDNPRTVTVTEDKQYTAQFAKSTYSITKIAKDDLGSINGPSSAECQQEVTLTAQPIEGYRFVQWSDGNKENPRTAVITQDTTFQAEFVSRTFYTLSLTTPSYQEGWGTETGAGEYESGTTVTIRAVPNYGYHFAQWSDGNTDNPRTIVITQDTTFQAEFAKDFYTLSLNTLDWQEGWGTETGAGEYEYGSTVTIKAVSNYGYHFMRWDDGNTDNPRTVTVTQNKTYTAVFARNIYSISVLWDPERGTVSYPSQEEYLRTVNISASPNTGYRFVKWNDGDKHSARSFVITQDTTFTAEFEPIKYTITFKNEDGSIIDQIECDYGTMPTHSDPTKPANGIYTYTFAGWQPALAPVTGNATYTAQFVEHEEISGECEDIHETWLATGQDSWGDMRCYMNYWQYSQIYGATIKGKHEDGLDTPARNLTGMSSVTLTFKHLCSNVSTQNLTLWVCPDFKDTEDDEWYELTIPNYSGSNGAYVTTVINVPLSYVGKNTVFGFSYDGSSSQNSSYWYIRNLQLDAICANSISYYTIRFLNMDSTVLQTMQVMEGDMPVYTGEIPTMPDTENTTFSFYGWYPAVGPATEDADYIAQYTATEMTESGCNDMHYTWLETGANDMGEITTNNAEVWTYDSRYGAVGSKSGGVTAWLLTPVQDLTGMENITLSFSHVHRYAATFENEMTLWVCADYQTSVETSSWQQLTIAPYASNTNWVYVDVTVEVPENKVGERTVFGFKYMSTETNYAQWEIKNLHLDAQCAETHTGVENFADQVQDKVRKILIDDIIYILRGDKIYTVTGQEVK